MEILFVIIAVMLIIGGFCVGEIIYDAIKYRKQRRQMCEIDRLMKSLYGKR